MKTCVNGMSIRLKTHRCWKDGIFGNFDIQIKFDVGYLKIYKNILCVFFNNYKFRWLKDLFKLGLQRPLEEGDIYQTLQAHECSKLSARFSELWEQEKEKKTPRLFNVIRKIYAKKIIGISVLFTAIDAISRYLTSNLSINKSK